MKIGFTFDLKELYLSQGFSEEAASEFELPETIDAIESSLSALGFEVDRIGGIHSLVNRLAKGDRWPLVFNFAEGNSGSAREAQVPGLLDAYRIPYVFSDAQALAVAHDKSLAKQVVGAHQVATAPFRVIRNQAELRAMLQDNSFLSQAFPLFVKPVAEGSSKGIHANSIVRNPKDLYSICTEILETHGQPALIETFLEGAEYTVGVLGTGEEARVIGVLEILFTSEAASPVYCYENKTNYENAIRWRLAQGQKADEVGRQALRAWRALGCRDGGRIDMRLDSRGVPHFIEANPLPGLNPRLSDLVILSDLANLCYENLIAGIVRSALARLPELGFRLRDPMSIPSRVKIPPPVRSKPVTSDSPS